MPDYGLLPEGFVPKTTEVIIAETEELLRGAVGKSFPLGDGTFAGFLNKMYAEREALIWEIAEASNSGMDPDKASGDQLKQLCLLTGTFKLGPTASTVLETLCGDPATVVPSGEIIRTSAGKPFGTTAESTIIPVAAWVATTHYFVGDQVTNASRCYRCITEGVSAGSGGPTTTSNNITDGTAHWIYLGEGTATIDVVCGSLDTGPVVAAAFDLTEFDPVGGLLSARNLLDAKLGRDDQTDESLRLLREADIARAGTGTQAAIRADLLALPGVTSVTVFINNTDVVDVNGMDPHSVQAMVEGGDDQAIWDQLLASVDAGIETVGDVVGTATDDEGTDHTESFIRPDAKNIYVDITVIKDPLVFPVDGVDQIKGAIAAFGGIQKGGKDAVASSIGAQAFDVDGVDDVTQTLIYTDVIGAAAAWINTHAYVATPGSRSVVTNDGGRTYICITGGTSAGSGGPTGVGTDITDGGAHWRFLGATIAIALRELAKFDTSRVNVHVSDGTP